MHLKMWSEKWRSFCLGLNVLIRSTSLFKELCVALTLNLSAKDIPAVWFGYECQRDLLFMSLALNGAFRYDHAAIYDHLITCIRMKTCCRNTALGRVYINQFDVFSFVIITNGWVSARKT